MMTPSEESKIYLLLGELRGDTKALLAGLQDNKDTFLKSEKEATERREKLDTRVTVLERSRYLMLGGAAVIGAVIGPIFTFFLQRHN